MRFMHFYSVAFLLGACVPIQNTGGSLYSIEYQQSYAEQQGWCKQQEPKEGPAVYYVYENGQCISKVKE